MTTPASEPARSVRAIDRALDVLSAFSSAHPRLALCELAEAVGLPKPSAYRIATTMVRRGFLLHGPDGTYSLGTRLLELGNLVSTTSVLASVTTVVADELSHRTGETVLVAEVDWTSNTVVITDKRAATHPLAVTSPVGQRSSIGGGCMGKAVIAGLDEGTARQRVDRLRLAPRTTRTITDPVVFLADVEAARRRGYAVESGEFLTGVSGVAVPVLVGGQPLGAIAVVGPTSRCKRRQLDMYGRLTRDLLAGHVENTARRKADGA